MVKPHVLFSFARPLIKEFFSTAAMSSIEDLAVVYKSENMTKPLALETVLRTFPADILVTGWGSVPLTEKLMIEHPQMRYLCHCGGEIKAYVSKTLIQKGLVVCNWGKLPSKMLAEAALMGILNCLRKTTEVHEIMHTHRSWMDNIEAQTETLYGKRVGIFGFGASGQELARLLQPFGCEVSAYSPFEAEQVFKASNVRCFDSLEQLFRNNKIISVHASLTKENYHVINRELLDLLPEGAVIVNTARGAIFDENALINVLKSGKIHASLDVFENEPLSADSALRTLPNVQLIPHQASPTADRRKEIGNIVLENIARISNGRTPLNIVDEVMYDFIT